MLRIAGEPIGLSPAKTHRSKTAIGGKMDVEQMCDRAS